MKNQPFRKRLGFALAGLRTAYREESSFRTQIEFAAGVGLVLIVTRPAPVWWAVISLTVGATLAAELFNTTLEFVLDRLHPETHPMIARAKDCAAGAVLILSFSSLAVGAALVFDFLGS